MTIKFGSKAAAAGACSIRQNNKMVTIKGYRDFFEMIDVINDEERVFDLIDIADEMVIDEHGQVIFERDFSVWSISREVTTVQNELWKSEVTL